MTYTLTKIASNPGLLTFELTNTKNEKLVFRPLLPTDNHKLADFLAGLSLQTRLFYTFESYDLRMAIELCEAIAKYDKLRFVVETSDNKIIGLFEFSFDLVQDDIDRYRKYGITLHQGSDCRMGPCLSDEYQNRGLGSKVFPYLVKIAKSFDQKRMILWGGVFAENSKAIAYYQKNGFRLAGNFINKNDIPCVDMIFDLN